MQHIIFRYATEKVSFQCLILAKEQRATSQAIADSLDHVKSEALQLRAQICEELNVVEEKCDSNNLDPVKHYKKYKRTGF